MRFKAEDYDEQVDALLDELIDPRTYAAHEGSVEHTRFVVALEMGLTDGDAEQIDADGYVMLSTPSEKIQANVEKARAARARGETLLDLICAGAFD